jgi:hypothetical protein
MGRPEKSRAPRDLPLCGGAPLAETARKAVKLTSRLDSSVAVLRLLRVRRIRGRLRSPRTTTRAATFLLRFLPLVLLFRCEDLED